jgi:hypothetical protein
VTWNSSFPLTLTLSLRERGFIEAIASSLITTFNTVADTGKMEIHD